MSSSSSSSCWSLLPGEPNMLTSSEAPVWKLRSVTKSVTPVTPASDRRTGVKSLKIVQQVASLRFTLVYTQFWAQSWVFMYFRRFGLNQATQAFPMQNRYPDCIFQSSNYQNIFADHCAVAATSAQKMLHLQWCRWPR